MQLLIRHGNERIQARAAAGALDELLLAGGVALERRCGRDGSCGGCAVTLEEGEFLVEGRSVRPAPGAPVEALACRTVAIGADAVVATARRGAVVAGGVIADDFLLPAAVRLDPAVRRVPVALAAAGLEERRSDQERIADAAGAAVGGEPVDVRLAATRKLASLRDQGRAEFVLELVLRAGRWELVDLAAAPCGTPWYGVALDLGTTTVAGLLVDLESGRIVGRSSRYNQQIVLAADVAARISAARTDADLRRLQRLLVADTLQPMLQELCAAQGVALDAVRRVSVAGNTVMTHLLLGLQVRGLGRLPFRPVVRAPGPVSALQLGLRTHPEALVDIAPASAAYVGGDIVADLVASDLPAQADGTLLIDIGTNAEIVLKDGGRLVCCATPAGPAFEGAGLLHGCRAATGAIAHFAPDLQPQVIGGGEALGVCGSAALDFLAIGRRQGWLDAAGRLEPQWLQATGRDTEVEVRGRRSRACVVARGAQGMIVISEADIAEILQAKSAVAAAWRTLLELQGRAVDQLSRVVLAGGFARGIDLAHAIAIGLLPALPLERFQVIGNGALAGAYLALVDRASAARMARLHREPKVVELNLVPGFEGCFIDNLWLPGPTDLEQPEPAEVRA